MSTTKTLLALGAGAVVAYLILKPKDANAASAGPAPGSVIPDGWTPPNGATFNVIAANTLQNVQELYKYTWDAEGTGTMVLLYDPKDKNTYSAVQFSKLGGTPAIMAQGTSPLSATLTQALVAGL